MRRPLQDRSFIPKDGCTAAEHFFVLRREKVRGKWIEDNFNFHRVKFCLHRNFFELFSHRNDGVQEV